MKVGASAHSATAEQNASQSNTERQAAPLLELRNVSKYFPGVTALDRVHLTVYPGEVHILLGENGAGKSTLVKILTGAYTLDAGEFLWEGRPVRLTGPDDGLRLGIAAVYQELSLVPHLTVAENIFLAHEPRRRGFVDWGTLRRRTRELMEALGHPIDPDTRVAELSVGQRQLVEIAKALSNNARLLILDEPTSSLGEHEVARLMDVIGRLQNRGLGIVYITHKLNEVRQLGGTVTILRDGRLVAIRRAEDLTEDDMVTLMVGRELGDRYPPRQSSPGEPALVVRSLSRPPHFKDVSFTVRRGEIVGMFGLVGAGRTEVARAIVGADPYVSGRIEVFGRPVRIASPHDAVRAGIAFLTEDRKQEGLILIHSLVDNVTLANLKPFRRSGLLSRRQQTERAVSLLKTLAVRPFDPHRRAQDLSGGNQQKVVLAKWLNAEAEIYIFDEPTRGIDVGAKAEIYRLMNELVARGKAVLMISSELPEILGMSDRILVMARGRLVAEFPRETATQETILRAATGGAGR